VHHYGRRPPFCFCSRHFRHARPVPASVDASLHTPGRHQLFHEFVRCRQRQRRPPPPRAPGASVCHAARQLPLTSTTSAATSRRWICRQEAAFACATEIRRLHTQPRSAPYIGVPLLPHARYAVGATASFCISQRASFAHCRTTRVRCTAFCTSHATAITDYAIRHTYEDATIRFSSADR